MGILRAELPRLDPVGDDRRDHRGQPDERLLADPVVQQAVLRPVEDLDELALVRLVADVANPCAEGQESLDRGAARIGRRGLDPRGHALDHRGGDRVHGIVLGREVEVERPLRDAGGADDVVDGRRRDALRREDGDGSIHELLAADLAPRGRGSSRLPRASTPD